MHKPKSSIYPRRVAVAGALTTALMSTTAYAQECVFQSDGTCRITNGATITAPWSDDVDDGLAAIETRSQSVDIVNSGNLSVTPAPGPRVLYGISVVSAVNAAGGMSRVRFTNSGTISATAFGATALAISATPAVDPVVAGRPIVEVSNSGTISAAGGALFNADPVFNGSVFTGRVLNIEIAAGLAVGAVGVEGESAINITNAATGTITAGGALRFGRNFISTGSQVIGFIPLQNNSINQAAPLDYGTVAIAVYGDNITITNDGIIRGGVGSALPSGVEFGLPEIKAAFFDDKELLTFPNRYLAGAIHSFADKRDTIINSATGTITGSIDLGGGDDRIENRGIITGAIFLRDGADAYVRGIAATQTGTVDGGAGTDSVLIDITAGGVLNSALYDPFTNFENFGVTGNGAVRFEGALPFETLQVNGRIDILPGSVVQTSGPVALTGSGGDDVVINGGEILGHVDLGAGNDVLDNFGIIRGRISLGDGDDRFVARAATIDGEVNAGAGLNTLQIHRGGTAATPVPIGRFVEYFGFQNLNFAEGHAFVEQNFGAERLSITGGSLFGLAASHISAPNGIIVGTGATFGSAGRVTGPVTVAGTLAPGASPGTMQVTGNVALQTGSTTVFEFTPTVSDRLLITGQLSIATGATLNITGSRPLTPGVTYNLITASGGISATFSTINKAATVLGFLRQGAGTLDLLGTLQLRAGGTPPVAAAVNYLNAALTGGTATPALVNAFPALVGADGFAREAAVATLHPEAYASASQIGIENGIAIADSLRSHSFAPRKSGAYTFAQALGSWRKFGANALSGTSRANVRSSGFLGGLGFGSESFGVSAFVGHASARQPIAALGARNASKGIFAGAHLDFSTDTFGVGGSLIYDGGKATTARTLFDSTALTSGYRLRSVTVDGYARLKFALGGSWQFGPEIGLTHVSVKRGAATEAGSGFALTVAKAQDKASFLRGEVSIARNAPDGFSPRLSAGVRHRTGRGGPIATASFAGVASTFTVAGVERTRTVGTGSAGFNARLSDSISLFGRAEHEFGQNGSTAASAGFRLSF